MCIDGAGVQMIFLMSPAALAQACIDLRVPPQTLAETAWQAVVVSSCTEPGAVARGTTPPALRWPAKVTPQSG
jgi:hypothetical protein